MEATLLLCDYAEQINGKLYIMGGGWSLAAARRPINIALAVKLAIPWDRTNHPYQVDIRLVTEDSEPVLDAEGKPIQLSGKVEVGRPPGLKPGTAIDAPLAVRVGPISLEPGSYSWELLIDGQFLQREVFSALEVGSGT